eukprot:130187_1
MFNENDTIKQLQPQYGSVSPSTSKRHSYKSRACGNQLLFVLFLFCISLICIIFTVYPAKKRFTQTVQEIDTSTCSTHICLYEITQIDFVPNDQMLLLQNHPSTVASSFAFVNQELFKTTPQSLTLTHTQGTVLSIPLTSFQNNNGLYDLYYYEDELHNRFVLSMDALTNNVEGYAVCNAQKFELHSIGDDHLFLLIQKDWIQDTTNWCGIMDINTQYTQISDDVFADDNDGMNEDIAMWLHTKHMVTAHVGLDGLFINKNISTQGFMVEPLCSDLSIYDGNVYCLYPDTNTWDAFDYVQFYTYSLVDSMWNEMVDFPLNLGDSSINIPQSMVITEDNEVYAFAVNPTDLMINIYSYTTTWRVHHYMPEINGAIDKVEIDSLYVSDVLYFSVNEYDPLGTFTLYHYTEDIFSALDVWSKAEVPVYSHCLTQFEGQLLTFYVDYGHNLWAYYQETAHNLGFNIANDIDTNQFECVWTKNGNIVSWMHEDIIYYLQLSADDFKQIVVYSTLPWVLDEDATLFQLISMEKSVREYRSVSVYYKEDIIDNYLTDIALLSMDISSIISLSNIIYAIHNNYQNMMKLDQILTYKEDVNAFTSYERESEINILLVDALSDEQEIGYSQCDPSDQSFAVVQYTVF